MAEPRTTDNRNQAKKPFKKRFDKGGFKYKKRIDFFKKNPDVAIDYKKADILVRFVSNKGKILPRRLTGLSPLHQRKVAKAIKVARQAGLLPFSVK